MRVLFEEIFRAFAFFGFSIIGLVLFLLGWKLCKNRSNSYLSDDYKEVHHIDFKTNELKTKRVLTEDAIDRLLE